MIMPAMIFFQKIMKYIFHEEIRMITKMSIVCKTNFGKKFNPEHSFLQKYTLSSTN